MGTGFSSSSSKQWIIKFMKPRCLCTDHEKKEQQQPLNESKARTLKEWLLASPSLNKNCSNGGECYVYKSLLLTPNKVHIGHSLYVDKEDYMSNLLDQRLVKVDEVEHHEHEELMISRSQSGKASKKRVSFKLPEETDIFIFYSPETEEEFRE